MFFCDYVFSDVPHEVSEHLSSFDAIAPKKNQKPDAKQ